MTSRPQERPLLVNTFNLSSEFIQLDPCAFEQCVRGICDGVRPQPNISVTLGSFQANIHYPYPSASSDDFVLKPFNDNTLDLKPDYKPYDCWLSHDGLMGFAVAPDRELVNVFSASAVRGAGSSILVFAKERYDHLHLNCYAGKVEDFYKNHGFYETGRESNWNGPPHPDIVYMRYER